MNTPNPLLVLTFRIRWLTCLGPVLACLPLSAETLTFDTPEYTSGATVVGVNDSKAAGGPWVRFSGVSDLELTASAGNGKSGRSLRVNDTSGTVASSAYVDSAGTVQDMTKPFTVAFDIRLGGTDAVAGDLQACVQFGRAPADAWNLSRHWLHFFVDGTKACLWVHDINNPSGGYRSSVRIGTVAAGTYYHFSATVDPVTRKYLNVMFDGVDVTNKVLTANGDGGMVPWRTASGESAQASTAPNEHLWLVSGTDDVLMVDLDNLRIDQSADAWVSKASEEWLPYLQSTTNLLVGSSSALDLSSLFPRTESYLHGRGFAYVDQEGDLAFSDGKARLFVLGEFMPNFPVTSDAQIPGYVDQVVRAGYNAYRPHFLDVYLMTGRSVDLSVDPARFTRWQKFAAELRKKGVYLIMDASTSWDSFYAGSPNAFYTDSARLKRLKIKLGYDQATRDHWKAAVSQLYVTANPYNTYGLALKDDPQVVFTNLRNEPSLYFQLQVDTVNSPALKDEPGLLAMWRKWLEATYGTIGNLNTAWTVNNVSPGYSGFSGVPLFQGSSIFQATGPSFRDLRRFEVDMEQDTFVWMQQVIRGIGVKSLLTDFNNLADLPNALIRDTIPLTDNHAYHDHPNNGSSTSNLLYKEIGDSAVDNVLQYVRSIAQSRQNGRPFTISEWGQVFWNPYRYEGGLMFPSYARLQGWGAITQHARAVQLTPMKAEPFLIGTDPVAKASEYMAAFLYGRGDVSSSSRRTEAVVDSVSDAVRADTNGFPYALKALPLLTRFGLRVQWPVVVSDSFGDATVTSATVVNDSSLGTTSAFWTTFVNSSSTATISSAGKLELKATGSAYPSAMVRTQASTALDFFGQPMQFSFKGPGFATDSVAANQQILRFVITSGTALAYNNPSALVVEIFGDNKIRLGYKVNAPGANVANWVRTIVDLPAGAGVVKGIVFNPLAADLNEANTSLGYDPAYDLVVTLSGTGGQPLYRRYTGRWHQNAGYPELSQGNWGATANTLQFEAQKTDGAANAKYVTATLDDFSFYRRPISPRADYVVDYSKNHPSQTGGLSFNTLVGELKTMTNPVLSSTNLTTPPTSEATSAGIYADGVYHSDTQELLLRAGQRAFSVITPRSEGATLPAVLPNGTDASATEVALNNVRLLNEPAPYKRTASGVLVSTLDANKTLYTSSRLLLIVSPDALNTGMAFTNYKRTELINNYNGQAYDGYGQLPVLLRRVKLKVKIRNVNVATFKVYPLNQDGTRKPEIATQQESFGGSSWLVIPIDTGVSDAAAVFFEIVTTQPVASLLEAWRLRHFGAPSDTGLAADAADPDADGVPNLLEFAQGGSPLKSGKEEGASVSLQPHDGASRLALTFVRDRAAGGVALAVEAADELTAPVWSHINPFHPANQVAVLADSPHVGLDTYTIADIQPLAASPRRFLRLRASIDANSDSS